MPRAVLTEQFYIPVKELDPDLEALIPPDERISYTSMIQAQEMGLMKPKKYGQLVLTGTGFAFRVGKRVRAEEGLLTDIDQDYVPYSVVFDLHNRGKAVKFRYAPENSPKERRGWVFKVQCCTEFGEAADAFEERQSLFGGFFEHLYKQATGVGRAREGLHLFASVKEFREKLRDVLPPEDTIYYSSPAKIIKTGFGGAGRHGVVVLTDTGIAIWGASPQASPVSLLDFSGMADSFKGQAYDYIPYEIILKFKDLRKKIRIIHSPREGTGGKRGWILKIVRAKNESEESWIRRRLRFGEIFEQLRSARVEEVAGIVRKAQTQLGGPFYVPVELLPWELKALVPPKDLIRYTSRALIRRKSLIGGLSQEGMLVLTDAHFVFRAPVVTRTDALKGAVSYELITEFENKGETVKLRHLLEERPKESQELEFRVKQCRQFWESRESFHKRKSKFGDVFEEQYRLSTGA
ncbi:MAG: hypothetical protein ACFFCO_06800 [Promethearchaeota archaeon]